MKIYHYRPDTSEYVGADEADKDPLQPDRFLVPANATTDPPPEAGEEETAVYTPKGWSIVPDYRGQKCWSTETREEVQPEVGEALGDRLIDIEPPDQEAVWDKETWQWHIPEEVRTQRTIRDAREKLRAIDQESTRPLRAKLNGTDTQADRDKLAELEAKAEEQRAMIRNAAKE